MTGTTQLVVALMALVAITVAALALYGEMCANAINVWRRRRRRNQ